MPPLHELCVVDHPEGAEVVLVADEALVQGEVGADRVLYNDVCEETEEQERIGGEEESGGEEEKENESVRRREIIS